MVDVACGHPGLTGEILHRCAVEAIADEANLGGIEDVLAAGRLAASRLSEDAGAHDAAPVFATMPTP